MAWHSRVRRRYGLCGSPPDGTVNLATKRKLTSIKRCCTPDAAKQRVLMREFEKRVVVTEAHEFPMLWWYRIIPYRSYVKRLED